MHEEGGVDDCENGSVAWTMTMNAEDSVEERSGSVGDAVEGGENGNLNAEP